MSNINQLIESHSEGESLPQEFYTNSNIFSDEISSVYFNQWLAVDHISRIPNAGDYFLFDIEKESIIIIRGRDEIVRAFYNVCTHRGSRVCLEPEGTKKLLVCPYHAWSFDAEGNLRAARFMPDNFNPKEWGLRKCHMAIQNGLIFLNLTSGEPDNFDDFIAPLVPYLNLHEPENSKIAFRKKYPTAANWKTTIENFQECYHCAPSHQSYSAVHEKEFVKIYGAGKGSGPDDETAAYEAKIRPWTEDLEKRGIINQCYLESDTETESGLTRYADRVPIGNGKESETENGKFASTLMGKFKKLGPDGGVTQISFNPFANTYFNNDFGVLFVFKPIDTFNTEVELIWLVDKDANEDQYDIDRMTWMWDVTTLEDTQIIEDNYKGILSKSYKPGKLSEIERAVSYFYNWYFKSIRRNLNGSNIP